MNHNTIAKKMEKKKTVQTQSAAIAKAWTTRSSIYYIAIHSSHEWWRFDRFLKYTNRHDHFQDTNKHYWLTHHKTDDIKWLAITSIMSFHYTLTIHWIRRWQQNSNATPFLKPWKLENRIWLSSHDLEYFDEFSEKDKLTIVSHKHLSVKRIARVGKHIATWNTDLCACVSATLHPHQIKRCVDYCHFYSDFKPQRWFPSSSRLH